MQIARQADPQSLINLRKYPLFNEAARAELVADARRNMIKEGSAILPEFVLPVGIDLMREEALQLQPQSHRRERMLGAYAETMPDITDARHPVRRKSPYRMWVTATDQMDPQGATLKIYEWKPLIQLVEEILELEKLFTVADPMMRCNYTFLGDGDEHGWHFDGNDFVVSLMIQSADAGGAFEFAPNIRDDEAPNFERVRDVMDEKPGSAKHIHAKPRTLALFRGRRALHRVTRVSGATKRIIALLSYHEQPGLMNGPEAQFRVFGRSHEIPAPA